LRLFQVNTNIIWQAIYRKLNSMKNAALSCRKRSSKTLPPPAGCHLIIPVNSLLKRPFTKYESMKRPHVIYIQHSARHTKCQVALEDLIKKSNWTTTFSDVSFLSWFTVWRSRDYMFESNVCKMSCILSCLHQSFL